MANPIKAFSVRFILLAILLLCSGAWLHADPLEATIVSPNAALAATGQNLSFVASSGDGGRLGYVVNSYTWSFGDGGMSSSSAVNHAYAKAGTYLATLTVNYSYQICKVMDPDGNCLTSQSRTGVASSSRSITVLDPPKVTSFSTSATTVRAGLPVTLTWGCANASSVSLSGVGTVSGTSIVVYPTATTTYTLSAINSVGSDYAALRVTVYTVAVTVTPPSASLLFGESRAFGATVSPANQGVSWSANGGSMSGGTYTGIAPGIYSVTATSLEDPTKSASATVAVASVSVSSPWPGNATVNAGGTLQFSSTVNGAANAGLTWSVSGGGSISSAGLFTASAAGTYTVTATSAADSSKGASTAVTVNSVVTGVNINPPSVGLKAGEGAVFTASASGLGGNNTAVTWSASGGSISSGGIYTAPLQGGTYSVTATSVQDPSKSVSATVSVASISVSTPTPTNSSVNAGSTLQFTSTVSGAANAGLVWIVSGGGSISPSGLFSATTAGSYTVTAKSAVDASKQASTGVTVNSVVNGVSINPTSINLKAGEGITFTASASGLGGNNTAVTWSTSGGSISSGGIYAAPLQGGTYSVTATSVQDSSKSVSATVSVATISVSTPTPTNNSVNAGSTLQFTSTVNGAANAGLVWSVSGGGSISPSGLFSATTAGSYTVTAKSAVDASKQASTTVTVNSVVNGVSISPASIKLKAGEGSTFTASASGLGGNNTAVTWSTSGGGISSGGVYSAPLQGGTYSVTATSVQDSSKFASATVSVATISVTTPTPTNSSVNAGSTLQFTSTVNGAANAGLVWSVSGGGSISPSGLFSAATAGSYVVTATSAADVMKTASTNLTVMAVVTGLTVSPATTDLNAGEILAFAASVSGYGGVDQAVTWSCSGGTITANGRFTAPGQAGPITITATSVQDPARIGTATVRVKGWALKWKKDIIYVGAREIAEVDALGMHVTLVDHLGSPRFQVNQAGTLEAEQKFLPFGESLASSTTARMFAKGFTNHEQTDPSGLIYMQARFYAPSYGRFLSPDPARDQHFEETQSWNIYSYVQNNPVMNFDPNGMELVKLDIKSSYVTAKSSSRGSEVYVDRDMLSKVKGLVKSAETNKTKIVITSNFRTADDQKTAQEATKNDPDKKAATTTSYHEAGMALDFQIIEQDDKGKDKTPRDPKADDQIIKDVTDTSVGLTWGGNWKTQKDTVHVEDHIDKDKKDTKAAENAKQWKNEKDKIKTEEIK
jgi:RHS repeat-associated protein